jgi:AcrR family transcriptional regulator
VANGATEKGERTRRLIIDAARSVFEEKGYVDVRVADITKRAGLAHGSFYTYFPSKLEVFQEIVKEVGADVEKTASRGPEHLPGDWRYNLLIANLRYLEVYRKNAKIYILMEQTATMDEQIKALRLAGRKWHLARVAKYIEHLQELDIASRSIDVTLTAASLVTMLVGQAFWLNVEENDIDLAAAAATLTDIWVKALTG